MPVEMSSVAGDTVVLSSASLLLVAFVGCAFSSVN